MTLKAFVLEKSFPCIMAHSIAFNGHFEQHHVKLNQQSINYKEVIKIFYRFIDHYRDNPHTLHSIALSFTNEASKDFLEFEAFFWTFLRELKKIDHENYNHDPRVSSDPTSSEFSYSLKEEAFFILLLHPDNPRLSRRYDTPSIIFNPHEQFEELRRSGKYEKIRDVIRAKDKLLQGCPNPMLNDFGQASEIYQYVGRVYDKDEIIHFNI